MEVTSNVLLINYYYDYCDVRMIIDNNELLSKIKQNCLLIKQIKARTYYRTWRITL